MKILKKKKKKIFFSGRLPLFPEPNLGQIFSAPRAIILPKSPPSLTPDDKSSLAGIFAVWSVFYCSADGL